MYVKDKLIEYRFRLIRDTIRIAKIDSIPYEVEITEVKETYKPPNLFDYLCYLSFGILIGIVGWNIIKKHKVISSPRPFISGEEFLLLS